MKKRRYYPGVLGLAAAAIILPAGIGKTWSYFTTYAEAAGGYTIRLGDRTEITESFTDWTKHVTIANEESSEPVYIRVRAFCGSQYTLTYSGEGWTLGSDGYYYYSYAVDGGSTTGTLDLKIGGIPEDPEELERFNVIVIYESTPVKHHEDGSAYTIEETDWSELLDTGSTESTGSPKEEGPEEANDTENRDTDSSENGENTETGSGEADSSENGSTENGNSPEETENTDSTDTTEGGGES